jgi:hypothetical protein
LLFANQVGSEFLQGIAGLLFLVFSEVAEFCGLFCFFASFAMLNSPPVDLVLPVFVELTRKVFGNF